MLVRSFAGLAAAELAGSALRLLGLVWISRQLGASNLGWVGIGLALSGWLTSLSSGFTMVGARAVASAPEAMRDIVRRVLAQRLLTASATYALYLAGVLIVPLDGTVRWTLAIYGLSAFTSATNLRWVLLGQQRTGWVASSTAVAAVLYTGLAFALVRGTGSLVFAPLAVIVGELAQNAFLYIAARPSLSKGHERWVEAGRRSFLDAATVSGTRALRSLSMSFDVLVVAAMLDTVAAGEFTAPRRFTIPLVVIFGVFNESLLPTLVHALKESPQAARALARRSSLLAAVPVAMGALVCTLFGGPIMRLLAGDGYESSGVVLAVLLWGMVLQAGVGPRHQLLLALRDERAVAFDAFVATAASVVSLLVLVPLVGVVGAALADSFGRWVSYVAGGRALRHRLDALDHGVVAAVGRPVATLDGNAAAAPPPRLVREPQRVGDL